MRKNFFQVLIIICLVFTQSSAVFASSINSVTRLNTSKGRVNGEKVDYGIKLPQSWIAYIFVDRVRLKTTSGLLEKITFYYTPSEKTSKPAFLMNFFVFDASLYDGEFEKILETDDFVFAAEFASSSRLTSKTDKALFDYILKGLKTTETLSSMIDIPDDQRIILKNTAKVGKRVLKSGTIFKDNTLFIPAKESLEALGYKVTWLKSANAISIKKGDVYEIISTKKSHSTIDYTIKMINAKAYLPSFFFIKELELSVEIDENYNFSVK